MKPSIPKGTRDFGPEQVLRRQYIFDIIRRVFQRYGYQPIETPAMENLATLTGKYGDEGDALLFKVLNNGDFLAKADEAQLQARNSSGLVPSIARRGLRYDLTVPFARFVVMHQNDISFPFKRYQIQPVWRADRPQRGRYQEFYQCDADVVGSPSLVYEAELAQMYDEVFRQLGLPVKIKINNRKVLGGIAEVCGIGGQFGAMTVAIDKLDKIGREGVLREMEQRGMAADTAAQVLELLDIRDLQTLKARLQVSEEGLRGVAELEEVFTLVGDTLQHELAFDPTLARGLSYYTGCIFEVEAIGLNMGSIGGGGRYDDLTGIFGLPNVSGVGISFGAERIYDLLEETNGFPAELGQSLQVLLLPMDEEGVRYAFQCLNTLRRAGIAADMYPEPAKLKKQMTYANNRQVPYTGLIGEAERSSGQLSLKNMATGEQRGMGLGGIVEVLME